MKLTIWTCMDSTERMRLGKPYKSRLSKTVFWILVLSILFVLLTMVADLFDFLVVIPAVEIPRGYYPTYKINASKTVDSISHNKSITVYSSENHSKPTKNKFLTPNNSTNTLKILTQSRQKQTHIGFLKVHKAGSTTMQNMLFRFGLKLHLNIVIPKNGNYLMTRGSAIPLKGNFKNYDIFACHTVYSKGLYDALLPIDSVKIGIIREPFDRMVSAAYYYRDVWGVGYLKKIPRADFIHNIVKHPEKYDSNFFSRTRNSMGNDFGFSRKLTFTDKDKISSYLDTLNKEFSLVMLTEYFEESLVLMRRLLSWSIADIVYLKTNTHSHTPTLLTDDELSKFKNTSFLDYAIYDYFLDVFKQKVTKAGNDLANEVRFFKTVLSRVHKFCNDVKGAKTLSIERSVWDSASVVTRGDCKWMNTKELPFIGKLRAMYLTGKPIQYES